MTEWPWRRETAEADLEAKGRTCFKKEGMTSCVDAAGGLSKTETELASGFSSTKVT